MPQYPRKVTQMTFTAGVKPPHHAGSIYTVTGGVATLVGKAKYISKGTNNSWPGVGWHMAPGEEIERPPELGGPDSPDQGLPGRLPLRPKPEF
jgi:hypothetical protein